MLELKRRGRTRVKTEIVEIIALPFPSSTKLKIWSFHVVVVEGRAAKKNVQKSVMHVRSCCFLTKPTDFRRSRCRRRRSFVFSHVVSNFANCLE